MGESDKNEIYLSPAPHIASPVTTKKLMIHVLISLTPLALYGIYLYGMPALIRILVSVGATVGAEAAFRKMMGRDIRIKDCSAALTGLLLALVMPPFIPIWIVILSAIFAIVVAKEFFGGLGANPFNPALVGRAFAFVSFSRAMTSWAAPHHGVDAVSTASSLHGVDAVGTASSLHGIDAVSTASSFSGFDAMSTATPLSYLKPSEGVISTAAAIAEQMGLSSAGDVYLKLFLGDHAGCIGESSAVLILIGFVYLLVTRVIEWQIPVFMVTTAMAVGMIAGVDPLLTLLSGGLLFGAVFMATDYATSPVTFKGRIIFGAGCGLLTALMRLFAGMPEGVMYSILIMNSVVTFLNKLIQRKYGFVKPVKITKPAAKGAK